MEDVVSEIGANIARIRLSKRWTQKMVEIKAKELGWGLAQSTLSAYEKGTRPLTMVRALMLSVIYDVPFKEIIPDQALCDVSDDGLILISLILERWGDYPRGESLEEQRGFVREIFIKGIEQVKAKHRETVWNERRQAPRGPRWGTPPPIAVE